MIVAIIQARMGATRLPGKVMKRVSGKTMLEYLIERLRKAQTIEHIVLATTEESSDIRIARMAKKLQINFFRGSENDVLGRYYQTACTYHATVIVRITGDCPLIDPAVIDQVVKFYVAHQEEYDYVSNVNPPTFPDGMDVEVFSFRALEQAWKEALLSSEREHVTAYIVKHPEIFRIGNVVHDIDWSDTRLTLDTPDDLRVIRKILKHLYQQKKDFSLNDIMKFLETNPRIALINTHSERNEGYYRSVSKDRGVLLSK